MLGQWCTNVMRSKVEPMKELAAMIRKHFDGIVAWTQTRQTTGFVEAINGLFQAAKRKARGHTRFQTMRTVLFLIAGKLNFSEINPTPLNPLKIQKSQFFQHAFPHERSTGAAPMETTLSISRLLSLPTRL